MIWATSCVLFTLFLKQDIFISMFKKFRIFKGLLTWRILRNSEDYPRNSRSIQRIADLSMYTSLSRKVAIHIFWFKLNSYYSGSSSLWWIPFNDLTCPSMLFSPSGIHLKKLLCPNLDMQLSIYTYEEHATKLMNVATLNSEPRNKQYYIKQWLEFIAIVWSSTNYQ